MANTKFDKYKSEDRRTKNKIRKLRKYMKKNPNDQKTQIRLYELTSK